MPPRMPQLARSALRICRNALTPPHNALPRGIHTTPPLADVGEKYSTARPVYDPYRLAKSKAIKERNLARQDELASQLSCTHVDPVLGTPTPFTAILDAVPTPLPSIDASSRIPPAQASLLERQSIPNHFLTPPELHSALEQSRRITFPPVKVGLVVDPAVAHSQSGQHAHSVAAIKRITSLALGSAKDKTRHNKQLCIATFGRHNTDKQLPRDPVHPHTAASKLHKPFEKTPRVGPDTGSSEVQAAILTAKIRALVEHMKDNKKDKMNKRNLRLLCHKRQKILKYLKRREKGGVRYRNIMESLGLDDHAIEMELMM